MLSLLKRVQVPRGLLSLTGHELRVYQSKTALWFRDYGIVVPKFRNVLALLVTPNGRMLVPASNIVTDAGDVHYAQRACGETPTNAFGIMELATAGTPAKGANRSAFTPVSATQKAKDGTYPRTADPDSDNTGAGTDVITHRTSWTTGDFAQTGITHGIITNTGPGASEPILTGYAFGASFDKTASDTLKVFVNHTQNGV